MRLQCSAWVAALGIPATRYATSAAPWPAPLRMGGGGRAHLRGRALLGARLPGHCSSSGSLPVLSLTLPVGRTRVGAWGRCLGPSVRGGLDSDPGRSHSHIPPQAAPHRGWGAPRLLALLLPALPGPPLSCGAPWASGQRTPPSQHLLPSRPWGRVDRPFPLHLCGVDEGFSAFMRWVMGGRPHRERGFSTPPIFFSGSPRWFRGHSQQSARVESSFGFSLWATWRGALRGQEGPQPGSIFPGDPQQLSGVLREHSGGGPRFSGNAACETAGAALPWASFPSLVWGRTWQC